MVHLVLTPGQQRIATHASLYWYQRACMSKCAEEIDACLELARDAAGALVGVQMSSPPPRYHTQAASDGSISPIPSAEVGQAGLLAWCTPL